MFSFPSDVIQVDCLFGFTNGFNSPAGLHPSAFFAGRPQAQQRCSRFPQQHHRCQDPFGGHRGTAWHRCQDPFGGHRGTAWHHHHPQQHPHHHIGRRQQRPAGVGVGLRGLGGLDFSVGVSSPPFADMFGFGGCGQGAAETSSPSSGAAPPHCRHHHDQEEQQQQQQASSKFDDTTSSRPISIKFFVTEEEDSAAVRVHRMFAALSHAELMAVAKELLWSGGNGNNVAAHEEGNVVALVECVSDVTTGERTAISNEWDWIAAQRRHRESLGNDDALVNRIPLRIHVRRRQECEEEEEEDTGEIVGESSDKVSNNKFFFNVGTEEEEEEDVLEQEPSAPETKKEVVSSSDDDDSSSSSCWDVASSYSVIDDLEDDDVYYGTAENDDDDDDYHDEEDTAAVQTTLPESVSDVATTAPPPPSSVTTEIETASPPQKLPQKSENEWLLSVHIPSRDGSHKSGRDLRVVVPNTASLATLTAACLALEPSLVAQEQQQQQQQQQPFNFAFFGKILCGPPTKQLREFGIGDNALLFAAAGRYADPDALKLYMIQWELDHIIKRQQQMNSAAPANTAADRVEGAAASPPLGVVAQQQEQHQLQLSKERKMMNESVIKLLIKLDGLTDVEGHLRVERKRLVKECNAVIDGLGFGDSVL